MPFRDDDPQHWRDRAAHMRVLASQMNDLGAMALMFQLADDYDELADRAEKRTAKPPEPKRAPRGRSPDPR
jgi:hypothetical protein